MAGDLMANSSRRPAIRVEVEVRHKGETAWMWLVRAIALVTAVAAAPAWISGQWVALVGSVAMFLLAEGSSPVDLFAKLDRLRATRAFDEWP